MKNTTKKNTTSTSKTETPKKPLNKAPQQTEKNETQDNPIKENQNLKAFKRVENYDTGETDVFYLKVCTNCKKEYTTTKKETQTCSDECAKDNRVRGGGKYIFYTKRKDIESTFNVAKYKKRNADDSMFQIVKTNEEIRQQYQKDQDKNTILFYLQNENFAHPETWRKYKRGDFYHSEYEDQYGNADENFFIFEGFVPCVLSADNVDDCEYNFYFLNRQDAQIYEDYYHRKKENYFERLPENKRQDIKKMISKTFNQDIYFGKECFSLMENFILTHYDKHDFSFLTLKDLLEKNTPTAKKYRARIKRLKTESESWYDEKIYFQEKYIETKKENERLKNLNSEQAEEFFQEQKKFADEMLQHFQKQQQQTTSESLDFVDKITKLNKK